MRRSFGSALLFLIFGMSAVVVGIFCVAPVRAAPPPPDVTCRGCHGDSTRTIQLASGEILSIGIDLAKLADSPHSSDSANPVACTGCHTGRARYQYPHAPNPAASEREFAAAVSENCQTCHYPHKPFHTGEADGEEDGEADGKADMEAQPTCADCHGSHTIDPVENLLNSMPDNCVVCHADKGRDWAVTLITPRPGIGQGEAEYAGSTRCLGCHEELFSTWRETLHAKVIQNPATNAEAVVGDFTLTDPDLTFGLNNVAYTIGGRWQQMYLTQTVSGTLTILPATWVVATQAWEPDAYHQENGTQGNREWLPSCGSCHVTGLDTQTWGFTEFGVGCEGCHGPAAAHAEDPENVKPFVGDDVQVCGACHSRGTSPDGHPFPATYRPGDQLSDHFTLTTDSAVIWPDGSAKANHQQYTEWQLGSKKALAEGNSCVMCHAVHSRGATEGQLKTPTNELCVGCHNKQQALVRHTPFHERAMQSKEFACVDCHMPKLATSATAFDLHSHSFLQPNPQASVDHGGLEAMPNACNTCHQKSGEDPEWAAQTIAYAIEQAGPNPGAFFGPGPTPTSPPPPTPIPSVGTVMKHEPVQTGQWLRTTFFVFIGVAALGLLLGIINVIRRRRVQNV